MFTEDIPVREINLSKRYPWESVLEEDKEDLDALVEEAWDDLGMYVPQLLLKLGEGALQRTRAFCGHESEITKLGIPNLTLLNLSYELSHVGELLFGCTAGVGISKEGESIHVRSLDWPLTTLGDATRIYEITSRKARYTSVGITGYLGLLSAMAPGKHSVTINWAPPEGYNLMGVSPPFLLRQCFDQGLSTRELINKLSVTPLTCSVFFVVCCETIGESVVIERTPTTFAIRRFDPKDPWLTQANHFVELTAQNSDFGFDRLEYSTDRDVQLKKGMKKAKTTEDMIYALDEGYVLNDDTYQQMAFFPGSNGMKVWRNI